MNVNVQECASNERLARWGERRSPKNWEPQTICTSQNSPQRRRSFHLGMPSRNGYRSLDIFYFSIRRSAAREPPVESDQTPNLRILGRAHVGSGSVKQKTLYI